MYNWIGDKDPFFLMHPTKLYMERMIKILELENTFYLIEEKGMSHTISFKGLDYYYQLMESL